MVKIPGAKGAIFTVWAVLVWPFTIAASVVVDWSQGTWKFTCKLETKNRGACSPLANCRESPPRLPESGKPLAPVLEETAKVPKAEAMLPGATGCPAAKLAAFTTPPGFIARG